MSLVALGSMLLANIQHPILSITKRTINNIAETMECHQVVPDVICKPPPCMLEVWWPCVNVQSGYELAPCWIKKHPCIGFQTRHGAFYTVCMVDPDYPCRKRPKLREYTHWLVGNVPGTRVENGDALAAYIPPIPDKNTGLHRYVLLVYKQPCFTKFCEPHIPDTCSEGRENFCIDAFTKKYHFGNPIAGNFFLACWDVSVKRTKQKMGLCDK